MPGFDGTGPKGSGPMTGGARGYCVLKVPESPEEPMTGLAGKDGVPVRTASFFQSDSVLAHLRMQAAHIENTLSSIRLRINQLEAVRRDRGSGA